MFKEMCNHHSTILIPFMKILTVGFLFLSPFIGAAEPKSEEDIRAFDRVVLVYCYALYVESAKNMSRLPRMDPSTLSGREIKRINDNNRQKIDFLEPYYFLIKDGAKSRGKVSNNMIVNAFSNGKSSSSRLANLELMMVTQECELLVEKLEAL